MAKRIIIIAGPNGAGKTTFAMEFLPNEAIVDTFINADLLAAALSPFNPSSADVRAGRLMLELINEYVERGHSFAFETTLSGKTYARMVPKWRDLGYRVKIIFIRLQSPELAIERVYRRTLAGGHSVPEEVVRRRYYLGWKNFVNIYSDLADEWKVYDNSAEVYTLVDEGSNAHNGS